jgi:transposase
MARPLLPDALWDQVEPLLPRPKPRRDLDPGREPLDRRKVLTGILFVLRTGIRWNDLPAELGCGSGSRCRRYLRAWYRAGVWHRLHAVPLAQLRDADRIDWSRAAVDSSFVRALGGGAGTGPSPVDQGRPGSKHHAVVERHGIPLAATATAANTPDVTALPRVVDAVPPVRGRRGPAPPAAEAAGRGPGLRQRPAPGGDAPPGDRPPLRPPPHSAREWPGGVPLAGRAVLRLAARLPAAAVADGLG